MSTALTPTDEQSIRDLVAVYERAEITIIDAVARLVRSGKKDGWSTVWADRKRNDIVVELNRLRLMLNASNAEARGLLDEALTRAYANAAQTALGAVPTGAALTPGLVGITGDAAIRDLVAQTTGRLAGMHLLAISQARTAMQQAIAAASSQALTGVITRRAAAQSVLDKFAAQGITGYVTNTNRHISLGAAVEAQTRNVVMRARINGFSDGLADLGHDLVYVSDSPQECKTCRPFEGKVLSLTGRTPGYLTVREAEAKGLHHANCTHSLSAYFKGVTKLPTLTRNPQGYAERQRLRDLERRLRASKKVEQVALDPAAQAKAARRTRDIQATIRDHVATTSAKRQPHRERPGSAR